MKWFYLSLFLCGTNLYAAYNSSHFQRQLGRFNNLGKPKLQSYQSYRSFIQKLYLSENEELQLYPELSIVTQLIKSDLRQGDPDTMDYKLISEDLFACNCYELPDTFNFGLPRPLDNDFFMIGEFSKYLMKRYGVDQSKYELGIATQVLPEPEGILLYDIFVDLTVSQSAIDNGEEYFVEVWFGVPLCAIEELFRNKGSAGVNEEFRKIIQFGIRYEKKSWETQQSVSKKE